MVDIHNMDFDELTRFQEALRDILAARQLESDYDLDGMEVSELELLNETVGMALDSYAKAEDDYERSAYERSVL